MALLFAAVLRRSELAGLDDSAAALTDPHSLGLHQAECGGVAVLGANAGYCVEGFVQPLHSRPTSMLGEKALLARRGRPMPMKQAKLIWNEVGTPGLRD